MFLSKNTIIHQYFQCDFTECTADVLKSVGEGGGGQPFNDHDDTTTTSNSIIYNIYKNMFFFSQYLWTTALLVVATFGLTLGTFFSQRDL